MTQHADERFREIYERHLDAVTAYVRRRMPADSVDDAVAETFLVCWRRLDRVPPDALPWLYAVARKTLANARRADGRNAPWAGAEATVPAPEVEGDPVLARAFALLGEGDREVLRLVAWEQLSPAEAARVLGCSAVACRVRLHRAKQRLARLLADPEAAGNAAIKNPFPRGATR
jgi:RNA polymerase sigma-70 factor (ECF subfamily)